MIFTRFEVFTAVNFEVSVFCLVTPCSVVVGYKRFEVYAVSVFRVKIGTAWTFETMVPTTK